MARRRGRRAGILSAALLAASLAAAGAFGGVPAGRPATSLSALGGPRGPGGGDRRGNPAGTAGMRPRPPGGPLAEPGGGGNGGGGGGGNPGPDQLLAPQVYEITQPQDLLDFVVDDERLSVIKVYASWCQTCAAFDVRYRKLASRMGDRYSVGGSGPGSVGKLARRGNVRFAAMRFDDPNNEEMCRLLNATKLPYILLYKGSRGKVADFQCGPSGFAKVEDAVARFADPTPADGEGAVVGGVRGDIMGGEQEWRVGREAQRSSAGGRQPPRGGPRGYGSIVDYPPSAGRDEMTAMKDEEIASLHEELSLLRAEYDREIAKLKAEHRQQSGSLREELREATESFENERRALSRQIESLTEEITEREREYRSKENETSRKLRDEMKDKEDEYRETLSGLNLRISELEGELFRGRNNLEYNPDVTPQQRARLESRVASLEREIEELTSKNERLSTELLEEKRLVVASAEEAARVVSQLERIRNSEDGERRALMERIAELEREMESLQRDGGPPGGKSESARREAAEVKARHEEEVSRLSAKIFELEGRLDDRDSSSARRSDEERSKLLRETDKLASRILELEDSIDERDKLLKTSTKAADILLDSMEEQKKGYEDELRRTSRLVKELEEAIDSREREVSSLRSRLDGLERAAEERSAENMRRDEMDAAAGEVVVEEERRARMAAEEEVGRLNEELGRMRQAAGQQGGGQQGGEQAGFGGLFDFGAALFGGMQEPSSPEVRGLCVSTSSVFHFCRPFLIYPPFISLHIPSGPRVNFAVHPPVRPTLTVLRNRCRTSIRCSGTS